MRRGVTACLALQSIESRNLVERCLCEAWVEPAARGHDDALRAEDPDVGAQVKDEPAGEDKCIDQCRADVGRDAESIRPSETFADLPEGTARTFDTGSVRGFLVNRGGTIAALSGVCTHLGCLLQLNAAARRLDCPCHSAAFGFDGSVLYKHMPDSIPPLPMIESRIRDGNIEVLTV